MMRFQSVLICCLLATSVVRADTGATPSTDGIPARSVGEEAPPFMLKVLNPQPGGPAVFDIRNAVGEDAAPPAKLLVMAFFATWCKPCRKELPTLVELNEKYKASGLQVISIAIDREPEAIAQIADILKENKVVHPVVSDSLNIVARRYLGSDTKLPSLVMVGSDGRIAALHQGYGDEVQTAIANEIQKALGLPPPAPEKKKDAQKR